MYPTLRKKAKRFLHVSISKAVNLTSGGQNLCNVYVAAELDEPNQRHKTESTSAKNKADITWNQTFTL